MDGLLQADQRPVYRAIEVDQFHVVAASSLGGERGVEPVGGEEQELGAGRRLDRGW